MLTPVFLGMYPRDIPRRDWANSLPKDRETFSIAYSKAGSIQGPCFPAVASPPLLWYSPPQGPMQFTSWVMGDGWSQGLGTRRQICSSFEFGLNWQEISKEMCYVKMSTLLLWFINFGLWTELLVLYPEDWKQVVPRTATKAEPSCPGLCVLCLETEEPNKTWGVAVSGPSQLLLQARFVPAVVEIVLQFFPAS